MNQEYKRKSRHSNSDRREVRDVFELGDTGKGFLKII